MFARWGQIVVRARWLVLAGGLALVVVGVTWGTGVFGSLSAGGFTDRQTMSSQVRNQITRELGTQDSDIVALYSSPDRTVDDPAFRAAVTGALSRVAHRSEVSTVVSFYDTAARNLVSRDRHATYAIIRLQPRGDDTKIKQYRAIRDLLL